MPEELAHLIDRHLPGVEQDCGHGMPQQVRVDTLGDAGGCGAPLHDRLDRPHGVARVAMALEQIPLAAALEMGSQFMGQGRQDGHVAVGLTFGVGQTCISDHYATAESVWSSISRHSGEGTSAPEAPETRCCHICNRNAPSMSLNVGVTLWRYQGRCRSTCGPDRPLTAYHRTASVPTNHAIGCARSTLRSLQTLGSCRPKYCLLSKNASSMLHLRQYPWMTNAAETFGSVATSASSRQCPSGSRTSTTTTGSSPHQVYHNTSRTTWTRRRRSTLGNEIISSWAG